MSILVVVASLPVVVDAVVTTTLGVGQDRRYEQTHRGNDAQGKCFLYIVQVLHCESDEDG